MCHSTHEQCTRIQITCNKIISFEFFLCGPPSSAKEITKKTEMKIMKAKYEVFCFIHRVYFMDGTIDLKRKFFFGTESGFQHSNLEENENMVLRCARNVSIICGQQQQSRKDIYESGIFVVVGGVSAL